MASILESHKHPSYERLQIQRRARSRFYQALTFLDGRKHQHSLKTTTLTTAFKLAEEWYRRELRASVSVGRQHPIEKLTTRSSLAELLRSYVATLDEAKRAEALKRWGPIQHFWRTKLAGEVDAVMFRAFYAWRRKRVKGISAHTLHKDVVLIRQLLKHAIEQQQIAQLPLIPAPGAIKENPRPWLTRAEWELLFNTNFARIIEAEPNTRVVRRRRNLEDFMMFMVESMLRVGELRALTVGQCQPVKNYLVIDVKGKRGHRQAIAGGAAPGIYEKRKQGLKASERLWSEGQRDAFRELLVAAGLRYDSFGNERNLKSLRATAISFAIIRGGAQANLLLIARNAGTSVEMIDRFYARRLSAEIGAEELAQSLALE